MRKKNRIIAICAITLIAIIGGGTYLHYNAKASADLENVQLGDTYAQKYNGKKCSVMKDKVRCNCSGCKSGSWDPTTCSRCGHKCNKHTR